MIYGIMPYKWGCIMKFYRMNKNNSILFITAILFISLCINIYTSVTNLRYKMLIGKETYKSVEKIRDRNESVLNTLNQCIKSGSVSYEELLRLYECHLSILDEFTNLLADYKSYEKENIILVNKKDKKSEEVSTEVYSRIDSLFFEYLNIQMKTEQEKMILEGKSLDNFISMRDLSNEINEFYKEFNLNKFNNLSEKDKEVISIKNNYWIEVLKNINSIMNSYLNHEFTI